MYCQCFSEGIMEYLKNAKVLSLKQYVQIIKVYLGIFVAE